MIAGVNLPEGQSASVFLQSLLTTTANTFPVLQPAVEGLNRKNLGQGLIRFEALRASSPDRVEIAEYISNLVQSGLVYDTGKAGVFRLTDYIRQSAEPLPLASATSQSSSLGLIPEIPYEGRTYRGTEIRELADSFHSQRRISDAAFHAMEWVARQPRIDLSGEKFVILGYGAELSPADLLSLGNATLLGIDLAPASDVPALGALRGGTVLYPKEGANLLTQPREIAATIREFAAGDAVHIGLFAYAGGKAREIRLTGAMHGLLRELPASMVKSAGMYVSPTSVARSQPEDAAVALSRLESPTRVESALRRLGLLKPNLFEHAGTHWVDAIVDLQGASYLTAQYEKRLFAEALAVYGLSGLQGERHSPIPVSSNVAGITRTRSMQIPTFQAGFEGAPFVGLETYAPETTKALSALLYLERLLNPPETGAYRNPFRDENEKAESVHAVQVHGGIYSHPYAIQGAITEAVFVGLAKKPRLIPPFVRSLFR